MPRARRKCDTFQCRHPLLVAKALGVLAGIGVFGMGSAMGWEQGHGQGLIEGHDEGLASARTALEAARAAEEAAKREAAAARAATPGAARTPFNEYELDKDVECTTIDGERITDDDGTYVCDGWPICVACKANRADVVLVPCGHQTLCRLCYNRHMEACMEESECKCPICRKPIVTRAIVYRP